MAHDRHVLPQLEEVAEHIQLGDDSIGTVLKSSALGVLQVLLQDMVTLGRLKLADGVDADDAVAMAQHTTLAARVTALETLLASDDLNLDEAQEWVDFMKNNATDITALTTSLNTQIAAVQADVDQNEADSDAADLALQNRATALEAFQADFNAAFTLVNDNGLLDTVVENDLIVNGNVMLKGTQVLNTATMGIKNIAAVDATSDATFSATGIAYTDAHAAKVKVRSKSIVHTDAGGAAFSTIISSGLYVSELQIRVVTGFDAGATLDIGHASDAGYFGSLTDVQLAQAGVYTIPVYKTMGADQQPRFTLSGAPTQGEAHVALTVMA